MRFFQTRAGELCDESGRPVPIRSAEARFIRTPGANLRRERTARGLTQERLAELADLNPRTVQKIEAGDITISSPRCNASAPRSGASGSGCSGEVASRLAQSSQFSTHRPGTFSKSTRLRVSSKASCAMQMAAIFRSIVPTRTRASRRR